jgi:hypothetical protein
MEKEKVQHFRFVLAFWKEKVLYFRHQRLLQSCWCGTEIANFGYIYKKIPMKVLLSASFLLMTCISFSQSWVWGKRGGSSDNLDATGSNREEGVYSMVTDSQKNIYMLSKVGTLNLNFDGTSDTGYADGITKTETALVSFSCDGTFRWSKIIGGAGYEDFLNVQIDNNDNIYVAGRFGDFSGPTYAQHIDDDVVISTNPIDYRRLFIIKYSSTGQLLWYKRPEPATIGTVGTLAKGLQIDSQGNLYWLVYLSPGAYVDGSLIAPDNGRPWYVLKYDSAGNFVNSTSLDLATPTYFNSVQFFRNPYNGNYFFSARASTEDGTVWATVGNQTVTHSMFLSSFNSSGQALWRRENTSNTMGSLQLYNLVFDSANNIYLGGRLLGFDLDSFMGHSVAEPAIPAFLMKMDDTATTVLWASHHNKGANGYGALVLNGQELGFTNFCGGNNFTWGSQTMNVNNPNDGPEVLFARFDKTSGQCLSLAKIPGNVGHEDYGSALAVDASGDYIVGGSVSSMLTFDNGTVTSAGGQSDFFIAKYATSACSPLGIPENTMNGVQITPNPASQELNLNTDEELQYMIFDLQGKLLLNGKVQQRQIDVTQLARALYVLKLQNNTAVKTLKFLKD